MKEDLGREALPEHFNYILTMSVGVASFLRHVLFSLGPGCLCDCEIPESISDQREGVDLLPSFMLVFYIGAYSKFRSKTIVTRSKAVTGNDLWRSDSLRHNLP